MIAEEAFQVGFHRDRLDDWSNFLADFGLVTFALGLIPGVGQELKATAELQAVLAAVGSSSTELYQMSSEAEANAAELQQLVGRYENVAQTANLSPTVVDPDPPPPPPPSAPPRQSPTDGPHDQRAGQRADRATDVFPSPPAPMSAPSGPGRSAPVDADRGWVGFGRGRRVAHERRTSRSAGGRHAGSGRSAHPDGVRQHWRHVPARVPCQEFRAVCRPARRGRAQLPRRRQASRWPSSRRQCRRPCSERPRSRPRPVSRTATKTRTRTASPDAEEDLEKDLDGDGKPDADHEVKVEADEKDQPAAASGGVDGGRAPVHVEMDGDMEQLLTADDGYLGSRKSNRVAAGVSNIGR